MGDVRSMNGDSELERGPGSVAPEAVLSELIVNLAPSERSESRDENRQSQDTHLDPKAKILPF